MWRRAEYIRVGERVPGPHGLGPARRRPEPSPLNPEKPGFFPLNPCPFPCPWVVSRGLLGYTEGQGVHLGHGSTTSPIYCYPCIITILWSGFPTRRGEANPRIESHYPQTLKPGLPKPFKSPGALQCMIAMFKIMLEEDRTFSNAFPASIKNADLSE